MRKFDMETLIKKAGGPFRLTVLIQKRLLELRRGAPKLVETDSQNLIDVIYQEILQDKISLVSEAKVETEEDLFDEYKNAQRQVELEFSDEDDKRPSDDE